MKKSILYIILMVISAITFGQSVYTVTKTTDPDPFQHPFNNDDNLCDPEMFGTLQWAINKANYSADETIIVFDIPETGVHEIVLASYLPQISSNVTIDATTQTGYEQGSPLIKINGENVTQSCFSIYNCKAIIKGFELYNFKQNAIWLYVSEDSEIIENTITSINNTTSFSYAFGLSASDNVKFYGNIFINENSNENAINYKYGFYIKKSNNCIIGEPNQGLANIITNCNTGIFIAESQQVKVSGNLIYNNNSAIILDINSNNGIQPPVINDYINGVLSGAALPYSTVEVFGSTGEENANEYLTSTIANENGDWSVGISTTYEFFAATQTDLNNNTSRLRNFRTCVYPSFNAIIDADDIVSLDTEYLWTLPEGYEPPPGTWATATYLIVCDNADPFLIYDQTSVSTIATSGMEEMPYFNWWEGECDMWTSESFQCIDWYFQNDLSDEIQILDGYGEVYEFDPAAWGVGVHIINAQYGSTCNLTRIYIEVLEAPDPTITPVGPFCGNDGVIQLQAVDGGGTWSGTGIVNTTAGTFVPYLAGAGQHTITYTIEEPCPATDEITITVYESPDPEIEDVFACINGSATLFTDEESPDATELFSWSGPNGDGPNSNTWFLENVQPSMEGEYTITVEYDYGDKVCSETATAVLDVLDNPQVNINPQAPVICNFGSVTLDADEWASYTWSTGETSQTIVAANTNETYSVTVTDQFGCTGTDEVTTTASNMTIKDIIEEGTCDGDNSGSISFFIAGGQAPFAMQWTSNNGFSLNQTNITDPNYTLENLAAGDYFVTITDNLGCDIEWEFVVEAGENPHLQTIGSYVCNSAQTGIAEVIVINNDFGPYTYSWSNGETSSQIANQLPGTYTVTVIDNIGCSAIGEVIIDDYIVNADFSLNHPCLDLDRIGIAWYFNYHFDFEYSAIDWENYDFYWDLGNGTTSTELSVPVDYTMDGYYCVSAVVSREECVSISSETVYVYPSRCFCMEDSFEPGFYEDYTVNSAGEEWEGIQRRIRGQIIIPSGAILDIHKCLLMFGTTGGITVEPGGTLIVSQTTLTSIGIGSCDGMWAGIEVHGQWGLSNNEQGKVSFVNGGNIIENAHIGVLLGERNVDYVCNPHIDPELGPFDTEGSCGWIKAKEVEFVNNGTDIKFVKPIENYQYQNPSYIRNCSFTCDVLLDECYNSSHPSRYGHSVTQFGTPIIANTRNPWAGGSNPTQRSPQGIWMQNQRIMYSFSKDYFNNKEICIESYDSKYDVTNSNFYNAIYGIRVRNSIITANNSHRFEQNTFDKIPGISGVRGAHIYLGGGILDKIRDNKFGSPNTIQSETDMGIGIRGASRFVIEENDFLRLSIGIRVDGSGTQTSDIRAGLSNLHPAWRGNQFQNCNTNILTRGLNARLRLRCNNCNNDAPFMYSVNFKNEGTLANQGFYTSTTTPQQYWGAGNEFYDQNQYNPSPQSRWISSNATYRYVHHTDIKTTPVQHPASNNINIQSLGIAKADNSEACSQQYIPWSPQPYNPLNPLYSFIEMPPIDVILPIRQDLINRIDSLEMIKTNITNSLDNGITLELLTDIETGMSNGSLKSKLIANSPLSDTVLKALLIEYPLSHGNFKNVMEINLPVSNNVEPYFFERLTSLPQGIYNQLINLQSFNPNAVTISALDRYIDYLTMERELHVNEILYLLSDSAYYNPEYTKAILNAETGIEFKKMLTSLLIDEGDYVQVQSLLNNLEQSENISEHWLSYHQLLLSLFERGKTIYQMDSTQLAYITELAYKCPMDNTVANAQEILYLLYGIEVEDCVEYTNRSKHSLVKDIDFVLPDTDAWVEDNFPNPFKEETLINYYLPENSTGSIMINDMFGRLVANYSLNSGENTYVFKKPKNLMPGVYTYGYIVDGKAIEYKKMIITQ